MKMKVNKKEREQNTPNIVRGPADSCLLYLYEMSALPSLSSRNIDKLSNISQDGCGYLLILKFGV